MNRVSMLGRRRASLWGCRWGGDAENRLEGIVGGGRKGGESVAVNRCLNGVLAGTLPPFFGLSWKAGRYLRLPCSSLY